MDSITRGLPYPPQRLQGVQYVLQFGRVFAATLSPELIGKTADLALLWQLYGHGVIV